MVNSVKEELLVTRREDKILFARVQDGKIVQLQAEDSDGGILGNIYVAKVRNIVKNINAAFVEFAKGQHGYLPLTGQIAPIHTDGTPRNDDRILIGDELIVQVNKGGSENKATDGILCDRAAWQICGSYPQKWNCNECVKKDPR